jgi:aryl-alcohol dehydrogenase-like predicted oxidoreductase
MKALGLSDLRAWPRFVSMQNHYNLVYREEEREMLPLCAAEGIAVIPWSPLARGLLAGSRPKPDDRSATPRAASDDYAWKLYDHPSDGDVMEATRRVAQARGDRMAEVALAWLLSKPVVTAPIIGATKLDHLAAALRSVDLTLSDDEVKALEAPYRPHAVRGWT